MGRYIHIYVHTYIQIFHPVRQLRGPEDLQRIQQDSFIHSTNILKHLLCARPCTNDCLSSHYCIYTIDVHSEWIRTLRKFTVFWLATPAIFNIYAVFPAFVYVLEATGQTPKYPVSKNLQAILWVNGLVKNEEVSLDYIGTKRPVPLYHSSKHRITGH